MSLRKDDNGRECYACKVYKTWDCFKVYPNRCDECTKAYRRSPEYRERNKKRQEKRLTNPEEREKQNERMRVYHHRPEIISKIKAINSTDEAKKAQRIYEKERRKNMTPEQIAHRKEVSNKNMRKFLSNPRNRMSNRMSCAVKRLLHGQKKGRHWEDLVGYTIDDLRAHLERLWEPEMTWENYGHKGWHIDHKRPVTAFTYTSYEDEEFKICWALENLMPRWCTTGIAVSHGSKTMGNINKGGDNWKFWRRGA